MSLLKAIMIILLMVMMPCVTVMWIVPVKGHPHLAKCLCCNLVTSRQYLFQHAKSIKHVRNATNFHDADQQLDSSTLTSMHSASCSKQLGIVGIGLVNHKFILLLSQTITFTIAIATLYCSHFLHFTFVSIRFYY